MAEISLFPTTFQGVSLKQVKLKRCWVAATEINEDVSFHSVNTSNPTVLFHFTLSFIVPLLSSRTKVSIKWSFFLETEVLLANKLKLELFNSALDLCLLYVVTKQQMLNKKGPKYGRNL